MSVEGIQIWVEGVARAAAADIPTSITTSKQTFTNFFIVPFSFTC
jgi:hypothetical protein